MVRAESPLAESSNGVPFSRAGRFPVLDAAELEILRTYGTEHEVAAVARTAGRMLHVPVEQVRMIMAQELVLS